MPRTVFREWEPMALLGFGLIALAIGIPKRR
jgi:hypothetical protein